jgi:hypothetical protein
LEKDYGMTFPKIATKIDLLFASAHEFIDKESVRTLRRVDFPAPEGPRIAVTLPSGNRRFISCKSFFPFFVLTFLINAYPSF